MLNIFGLGWVLPGKIDKIFKMILTYSTVLMNRDILRTEYSKLCLFLKRAKKLRTYLINSVKIKYVLFESDRF